MFCRQKRLLTLTALLWAGFSQQPALSSTVDLTFLPPKTVQIPICIPRASDRLLLGFWADWDGQALPDQTPRLIRRDLRRLRDLDPQKWADTLARAYALLPGIDANFGKDARSLARAELLIALGEIDRLRQEGLVRQLLYNALQKSPHTKNVLARFLRLGLGVDQTPMQADVLLVSAAYGGNADALLALAERSLAGEKINGWDIDPELAVSMAFSALVGKMNPFLCDRASRIAREYRSGQIVSRNIGLADLWYRFSADLGDPAAAWKVADLHLRSEELVKDNSVLLRYLRIAADGGVSAAQLVLAQAYATGTLLPVNRNKAQALFALVAKDMGRLGLMRQTLFLERQLTEDPVLAPPFELALSQLSALPDSPGWALRKSAARFLASQGRWAGEAQALTLLAWAAAQGDGEALQRQAELQFRLVKTSQEFYDLTSQLVEAAVQFGRVDAMQSLSKAYACRAPDAPLIDQARYWTAAEAAVGTDGAGAVPWQPDQVIKARRRAVAQTLALKGSPTAVAAYQVWLGNQDNSAGARVLWDEIALDVTSISLARGKLALASIVLSEALPEGQAEQRSSLQTEALKWLRQAVRQNDTGAHTALALALTDMPKAVWLDIDELQRTLLAGAATGDGKAMTLLTETARFPNARAVYDAYGPVIAARGDFDAVLLALPFLTGADQAAYVHRAIAIAPCDVPSSLRFASVLALIGKAELARQWLTIAEFLAGNDGVRLVNLGDAHIRLLGQIGLVQALATYERAHLAGHAPATERLIRHLGNPASPAYDPKQVQALYLAQMDRATGDELAAILQQIEAAPTALRPDALSPGKLRHLYRKAAQSGTAKAQRVLAEHLRRSATSAVEFTESTLRLRRAAKAGDRIAMRLLAQAYGLGIGTSPAPALASFWLEKAALAGDAAAAELVPGLGRGKTDR